MEEIKKMIEENQVKTVKLGDVFIVPNYRGTEENDEMTVNSLNKRYENLGIDIQVDKKTRLIELWFIDSIRDPEDKRDNWSCHGFNFGDQEIPVGDWPKYWPKDMFNIKEGGGVSIETKYGRVILTAKQRDYRYGPKHNPKFKSFEAVYEMV